MNRAFSIGFAVSLLIAASTATSAEAGNRRQFFREFNGFFGCPASRPCNYGRYLRPGDTGPFAARIAQLRALIDSTPNPQARQVYAREILKLRALQSGY